MAKVTEIVRTENPVLKTLPRKKQVFELEDDVKVTIEFPADRRPKMALVGSRVEIVTGGEDLTITREVRDVGRAASSRFRSQADEDEGATEYTRGSRVGLDGPTPDVNPATASVTQFLAQAELGVIAMDKASNT